MNEAAIASFFVSLNLSAIAGLIKVARNKPTIVVLIKYTASLARFCGCTNESVNEPDKQAKEVSGSSKKTETNLSALKCLGHGSLKF